ncbi:hypothetical protein HA464_00820 [Rhizobium leguminosarum bv. trifolii]|uniref:Uncharacterized protein n=1 Tax=Rhizobium ruizarguesonis TaxID=2081791 RepID=A0AAE4YP12_9HYPH|nr:hypothetical protein [Rhizobium ruizarguesonis]MBY5851515.1 hypothetical protein [Rhizobium leguminosarum]NKL12376.1 hypothetical protein [Rhizobium leguminosarum bv. viciae]QIO42668.1 hypothetical protein HA464_00820 [Rhizobium leguminosarum bv. trifolii]MBY5887459.1 hypothetical protein [Rhizobium leguminosarum]MBY5894365.1 hypothetical protein [Rhizobium leguminosarum]
MPEPERTRTVPTQKVDASPARSFDWPKIRRYTKNATLALLISIKLAVVIIYVLRLNASHSFQEYTPPIAMMAALSFFIVAALWLAGMKLSGSD